RAGPVGTGQRRPSRSPRSQRSRSADVDCLKKYTERRVEERRHTEIPDTSKLDPSRWIPLPKTISRIQPATKKSPQSRDEEKRRSVSIDVEEKRRSVTIDVEEKRRSVTIDVEEKRRSVTIDVDDSGLDPNKISTATLKKLSPMKEEETKSIEKRNNTLTSATHRTAAGRSQSADVGHVKTAKLVEERRNTECSDPRMIATRWLPRINTSRFRYDAPPFAKDITRYAAAKWMTFVRNPSPSPIPRLNPERKSSSAEEGSPPTGDSPRKSFRSESPKWEPMRKFSSPKNDKDTARKQDDSEANGDPLSTKKSPDSNDQSSRLTERMRDLYDFKTENEWPKRATNARRENMWISKSSSEEDKTNQPVRRNSQDLEFNDRVSVIKLKDTKVQSVHQELKQAPKKEVLPGAAELSTCDYEERLRKFNERLRYSEDLGSTKPKIKERRTYSDDYDQKTRRASTKSAQASRTAVDHRQIERNKSSDATCKPRGSLTEVSPGRKDSDVSNKSRGSYAEISPLKRESNASNKSKGSFDEANPLKRESNASNKSRASYAEVSPLKKESNASNKSKGSFDEANPLKRESNASNKSRGSYAEVSPLKRESNASNKSRGSYAEVSPLKRESNASNKSKGSFDGASPLKRESNASNKSRESYDEVNPLKRDSRASDTTHAGVSFSVAKRASVDCKSTSKKVELPPRRAFSQTEERPSAPVPPVEWNDDRYAAARLKQLAERQKRDSTRYKVYLT
ncbi:uncharacterized protein LOC128879683, partial [Hylaeus volcanicus]|uniref:uncharacterized protein LOC128879683 n=1 Tax=Hylaeus volcanicus TaxID=313075 RepID=UPI0023B81D4B